MSEDNVTFKLCLALQFVAGPQCCEALACCCWSWTLTYAVVAAVAVSLVLFASTQGSAGGAEGGAPRGLTARRSRSEGLGDAGFDGDEVGPGAAHFIYAIVQH